MRKTNRNLKRLEFRKKLIKLLVIQILIVLVFLYISQINKPVPLEDTKSITITVDDTFYGHYLFQSGKRFSVISNSVEYRFNKTPSGYSVSELNDRIKIGDSLSIIYVERSGLWDKSNFILDARTETEVFESIEMRNAHLITQRTIGIVVFIIVELIFLAASTFIIWYDGIVLKLFGFR